MTTIKSRTVSVSIAAPQVDVYDFVANPVNLPRWAPTFCQSVSNVDGRWIVQTSDGPMEIRFVERNHFGVLDHAVVLPSGLEVLNPMRVIPNGDGSKVLFTLFLAPDMSDEKQAEDARLVARDLNTLKNVIEGRC
jgi:hypothetical protein